jgi:hypothetical protein
VGDDDIAVSKSLKEVAVVAGVSDVDTVDVAIGESEGFVCNAAGWAISLTVGVLSLDVEGVSRVMSVEELKASVDAVEIGAATSVGVRDMKVEVGVISESELEDSVVISNVVSDGVGKELSVGKGAASSVVEATPSSGEL